MNKLNVFPASFRVIGVGNGIEEIINQVKSFGFNGVFAEVVKYPFDCNPNDDDKLAIIVHTDCDHNADRIAKTFHEAGVLTIGFSEDADTSCYDSIMQNVSAIEAPKIIKELLQPVVNPGEIVYDFHDLNTALRNSGFFVVRSASGNNLREVVEKLQTGLSSLDSECVDFLSIHIYFNPNGSTPITMNDRAGILELMSSFPNIASAIWSVNHDKNLTDNEIKLSVLLAGKEMWKYWGNYQDKQYDIPTIFSQS